MLNVELNGREPDPAQWHRLVTGNYGHYTSMQVRDGMVRGMALHLARLDDGNEAFFGARMDVTAEMRLRELIRHALAGRRDASVRVSFHPGATEPDVLVAVSDPAGETPAAPWRVRTTVFERPWPEQKHTATMGAVHVRRQAVAAGFQDALLTGTDGFVREGTTWNVAFWDGHQVIWPQAPILKGVTMVLLQVAMTMTGVPWTIRPVRRAELPDLVAAAAVNSVCPAQPLAAVDDLEYDESPDLAEALLGAWKTVPYDEI